MTIEILTGALVIITGFYAWITFRIMRANERTLQAMRDQNTSLVRPYVNIGVLTPPHSVLFFLRIANTGRTGAENVRLELDRDFYQYGRKDGTNLRSTVAFQEPIEQLPPGAEIVFGLAQGFVVLGEQADPALTPPVFAITARYSYGTHSASERTVIDLRPYRDSMRAPDTVAAELKKLREEELKAIGNALTALAAKAEA